MAVDPILAADLSVAADPNAVADLSAVEDRYEEVAHTAVRNAAVGDRYEEAAHTAVRNAAVGDRYGEAAHTAARNAVVGDRCEEAAHTAAQIAVAVDLTSGAAQIAQAIPNAAAVQSAVVDRILAAVRNEPVDLIAAPNAAMSVAQIFPSAPLGRVSMVLRVDSKAQNAETRFVLDCQTGDCQTGVEPRSDAVRAMAYHHRHAVQGEQLVRADRHASPSYAALVTYPSTGCSVMLVRGGLVVRHPDSLAQPVW